MLLENKRIFIVEDNIMNRIIYQEILRSSGAWVEFDRSGRDTLSRLKLFKPDLIILDLMLPFGSSGYSIFDSIRKMPEFHDVPVVAVSATEPNVGIPQTQRQGFNGFIAKPIDDDLFPQQILQIFKGEQVWDAGDRLRN